MVFGWFKKKAPVSAPASAARSISVREVEDAAFFVQETMETLGYLLPSAAPKLMAAMSPAIGTSGDSSLINRKAGEQMDDLEKKRAGIRKSAMLRRDMFEDLTEKGRAIPLDAHAVTFRRSDFSMNRARSIAQAQALGCDRFEYMADGTHLCASCDQLDGRIVSGAEAHVIPPPSCTCETGRYLFRALVSFD